MREVRTRLSKAEASGVGLDDHLHLVIVDHLVGGLGNHILLGHKLGLCVHLLLLKLHLVLASLDSQFGS